MANNRTKSRPNGAQKKNCQFKLVLSGEPAVGKSSLVFRFVKGQFYDNQESTIGAAFLTQTVALDDITVKFEIWDTAGQEKQHSLAPTYYRGAQAAIVVYDLTNKDSFNRAKTWVKELQRQASPNIVIALAGNKTDLSSKRAVDRAEADNYATENGLLFMETSAKTSINVSDMFAAIAIKLLEGERSSHNPNQTSGGQRAYNHQSSPRTPTSSSQPKGQQQQSPYYAGAKFLSPPLPIHLPKPPEEWLLARSTGPQKNQRAS